MSVLAPRDGKVALLWVVRVAEERDAAGRDDLPLVPHDVLHRARRHPRLRKRRVLRGESRDASGGSGRKADEENRTHLSRTAVAARLPLATEQDHALVVDEERVGAPRRDLAAARERVGAGERGDLHGREGVDLGAHAEAAEACEWAGGTG